VTGRALAAGLLAVLAVLTAAGAVASPQPDPVCRACGSSFEQVADDRGYDVTVVNSTATVRVHENGSATWTATNRLAGGDADALAEPDAAESVAHAAVNEGWGLPHVYEEGSLTVESVAVEGRSVTVEFTDSDAGARRLGTLVVDYFHSDGVRGGWTLNVDEFALVGPPTATVPNDPAGSIDESYSSGDVTAAVDGGRLTLRGSLDGGRGPMFSEDLYVVYGDSGTADWRVTGATALSTAPIWLGNLGTFVLPTMFVFGGVMYIVAVGADALLSSGRAVSPRQVAALGGLALAATQVVPNGRWLVGVAAVYLAAGGAGLVAPRLLRTDRGTAVVGLASLVAAAGSYVALEALLGGVVALDSAVEIAVYHCPIVGGLFVGHALAAYRAGDRLRSLLFGAAVTLSGWFVAGAVSVPVASTPSMFVLPIMVAAAVVGPLVAAPLVALGACARENEGRTAPAPADTAAGSPSGR
jgi:hypothetical protein